jgi:hypothetical protein
MMVKRIVVIIGLLLAGCSGGAVVFAPTPPPLDQSPIHYDHPSGAFSLSLPRQWSIYEQNMTTLATAAFAAPGSNQPTLVFAAVNLGREVDTTEFGDMLTLYQTQVRPDTGDYVEQSRQAMGDGSWRMTGVRSGAGGETQKVNTFIQRTGTFVGLIEVLIPDDAAQMQALQTIVNTFTLHPEAALDPTDLTTFAYAKDSSIGVLHVATWTTPTGVFFVTGEVANYGLTTVSSVPVAVALLNADGLTVQGAVDQVMGHGIPPGGFAPFSLRFGQGQPSLALTYSLTLGGEAWQPTNPVIYGQNEMTWTDESHFDSFSRLVVSGSVTNISDHEIREPRAIITVFDSAQNVIGAGFGDITPAERELAPGETATFEITLPELGGDPENYIVNVQGVP